MRRPERRFYLRLARALGYVSVRRMLAEVTSDELTEWWEDYRISPWGEDRDDLRSAMAASAICNSNGAKTQPKDFIPDFGPAPTLVQQLMAAGLPVKIKGQP